MGRGPQPGIMDIALYEGGAAHVAGISDAIKLSSNETPLGPSPKAIAAYKAVGTPKRHDGVVLWITCLEQQATPVADDPCETRTEPERLSSSSIFRRSFGST